MVYTVKIEINTLAIVKTSIKSNVNMKQKGQYNDIKNQHIVIFLKKKEKSEDVIQTLYIPSQQQRSLSIDPLRVLSLT